MDEIMHISIPQNLENIQLPSPELLMYYKNLEHRVIWLDSNVDDMWLEYERKIIEWNREDKGIPTEERKPIKLMFFSYGGHMDINYSFIDLIQKSKTPIWGINMGQACSELGKYLIKYTKITQENLDEKFASEWYLTADDAIKLGVADKIVDDIEEII